jgi:hypothetical protein
MNDSGKKIGVIRKEGKNTYLRSKQLLTTPDGV